MASVSPSERNGTPYLPSNCTEVVMAIEKWWQGHKDQALSMRVKASGYSDLIDSRKHHLVQGKSTTYFAEGIQSKSKRAK